MWTGLAEEEVSEPWWQRQKRVPRLWTYGLHCRDEDNSKRHKERNRRVCPVTCRMEEMVPNIAATVVMIWFTHFQILERDAITFWGVLWLVCGGVFLLSSNMVFGGKAENRLQKHTIEVLPSRYETGIITVYLSTSSGYLLRSLQPVDQLCSGKSMLQISGLQNCSYLSGD